MPMLKTTLLKILKIAVSGTVIYQLVDFCNKLRRPSGGQGPFFLLLSATVAVIGINAFVAIVVYILFPRNTPSSEKPKERKTIPL
jgi:hypothetical protein